MTLETVPCMQYKARLAVPVSEKWEKADLQHFFHILLGKYSTLQKIEEN